MPVTVPIASGGSGRSVVLDQRCIHELVCRAGAELFDSRRCAVQRYRDFKVTKDRYGLLVKIQSVQNVAEASVPYGECARVLGLYHMPRGGDCQPAWAFKAHGKYTAFRPATFP